jgi:hypothetical protein
MQSDFQQDKPTSQEFLSLWLEKFHSRQWCLIEKSWSESLFDACRQHSRLVVVHFTGTLQVSGLNDSTAGLTQQCLICKWHLTRALQVWGLANSTVCTYEQQASCFCPLNFSSCGLYSSITLLRGSPSLWPGEPHRWHELSWFLFSRMMYKDYFWPEAVRPVLTISNATSDSRIIVTISTSQDARKSVARCPPQWVINISWSRLFPEEINGEAQGPSYLHRSVSSLWLEALHSMSKRHKWDLETIATSPTSQEPLQVFGLRGPTVEEPTPDIYLNKDFIRIERHG